MNAIDNTTCVLLAELLADDPTAVDKLLTEHLADNQGHCKACTIGGQRGQPSWPCTLHAAATLARMRGRRPRSPSRN